MSRTIWLTGICLCVVLGAASSSLAQTSETKPAMAAPAAKMAPAAPPAGAAPASAYLTEAECTKLGGSVVSESNGICNSGKFCATEDQNGKGHMVCISKMTLK